MKLKVSDKARSVIATVAPTLGVALGGPLGGLAGNLIASALGSKDVEQVILEQNPETLLALRKAEQEFEMKLEELGVEKERIAMADRASAREMAKVNMKPQMIISAIFLGGYFSIVLSLIFGLAEFDEGDGANLNLLLGVLTTGVPIILAFWFGSTAGSAVKSTLLAHSKPAD